MGIMIAQPKWAAVNGRTHPHHVLIAYVQVPGRSACECQSVGHAYIVPFAVRSEQLFNDEINAKSPTSVAPGTQPFGEW
jgi:hypothetical protein